MLKTSNVYSAMLLSGLFISTLISPLSIANDTPFSVYDTSRIKVDDNYQQVSRVLAIGSYEQSFDFLGGQLTPQLTYSMFRGNNGSDIAQDIQGFSNIDAEHFSAWQEVNLNWQNDTTLIRIGQLDANANFVSLVHAGQFINASFGLTPTALPLPTYPDMEYGLYAEHKVSENLGFSLAYYRPDEVDDTGEQQPLWMGAVCLYCNDKITINTGYWTVKHQHVKSISGYFAYVEGEISEKLHGFTLVSINDRPQTEDIKKHIKLGVTYDAPFSYESHQVGVGYSKVFGPDDETAIEAFYLLPINSFINLQPDIQWINNKITPNIDNLILTLRVQFYL